MGLPVSSVECLLMAILAVNSYSLDKAWKLLPRMRELGLTDPARVVAMDMPPPSRRSPRQATTGRTSPGCSRSG
jgi:hypothetical protein